MAAEQLPASIPKAMTWTDTMRHPWLDDAMKGETLPIQFVVCFGTAVNIVQTCTNIYKRQGPLMNRSGCT